jgi:hypothetical protein
MPLPQVKECEPVHFCRTKDGFFRFFEAVFLRTYNEKVLPELAIYADVEGDKEQEGYQPVDYQVHVDDVDLGTIRYVYSR